VGGRGKGRGGQNWNVAVGVYGRSCRLIRTVFSWSAAFLGNKSTVGANDENCVSDPLLVPLPSRVVLVLLWVFVLVLVLVSQSEPFYGGLSNHRCCRLHPSSDNGKVAETETLSVDAGTSRRMMVKGRCQLIS